MLSTLDRLRTLGIVGLLGIALTHAFELPDKLNESAIRYQGILFIALIVGCVLLAAAARQMPPRAWWSAALALALLPLAGFIVSRTAGLPGGADDVGAWGEPAGIASLAFEALTIVLAARALQLLSTARERVPTRAPARQPARAARPGQLVSERS